MVPDAPQANSGEKSKSFVCDHSTRSHDDAAAFESRARTRHRTPHPRSTSYGYAVIPILTRHNRSTAAEIPSSAIRERGRTRRRRIRDHRAHANGDPPR